MFKHKRILHSGILHWAMEIVVIVDRAHSFTKFSKKVIVFSPQPIGTIDIFTVVLSHLLLWPTLVKNSLPFHPQKAKKKKFLLKCLMHAYP